MIANVKCMLMPLKLRQMGKMKGIRYILCSLFGKIGGQKRDSIHFMALTSVGRLGRLKD